MWPPRREQSGRRLHTLVGNLEQASLLIIGREARVEKISPLCRDLPVRSSSPEGAASGVVASVVSDAGAQGAAAGTEKKMTSSTYRWVIVAAGGLLGCVAIGAMFSLPVFLQPIARDTGWSVTGVSSAMTIGFVAMALASMAWGSLSDRFGPRLVVLIGSIVLAASLALASQATSLLRVPADLRPARRRRDRRDLRADDGLRDRLVRHPSQPCRLARVGRHGHGADDHVAVGGVARLDLRLADIPSDHRRARRGLDDPGDAAGAPPAGPGSRRRRRRCRRRRAAIRTCRWGRRCDRLSSSSCC